MSTTVEVQPEATATEAATAEATATEETKKEEKPEEPVKEKKTRASRAPREKKPKEPKTAAHPPYFQMIKEAILALNDKSGSSTYAIAKYMEEKHKAVLPANFRKILALQLKNSAARGKLLKIRASFKLSEEGKKEKRAEATKVARAIPERKPRKTRSIASADMKPKTMKKSESAKPAKKTKKSAPAKPKQPKSIRSPAAKRAKKSVA